MDESAELVDVVRRMIGSGRVLVALSGGIDSVTLLHAAAAAGVDLVAAHVDHGLRPDSADDARFCARLAARLDVAFQSIAIEVDRGNSTQGRARRQRYAALARQAVRTGSHRIATAHHADDAVESAWLQAARGAGPIGRAGPQPEMSWWGTPVVRPLLEVPREAIAAYARREGLQWRDDPTNTDRSYRRNYLRHDVLPDAVDPSEARASMPRLRREAAERRDMVLALREGVAATTHVRRCTRDLLSEAPRDVAARLLLDLAGELQGRLAGDLVDDALDAIADDVTENRRFTGSRVVVEVSNDVVTLEATRGQGTKLLDRRRTVEVPLQPARSTPWVRGRVDVAADARTGLVLRGPRPGERIRLEVGSKPIADRLAEAGIPPSDRWWWPAVFDGDRCIQLVGIACADGESPVASFLEFSPVVTTYRL